MATVGEEDQQLHSFLSPIDESERDEFAEIKKLSRKETSQIRKWRVLVNLVLAVAGGIVTTFMYRFHRREQLRGYGNAVSY